MRVRQSIEEAPKVKDVMLRISHDLHEEKGHVFNYNPQETGKSIHSRLGKAPALSLPEPLGATGYVSKTSVEQGSLSNLKIQGSTVFSLGASYPAVSTGNLGSKRNNRNRPPAWVRRTRTNQKKITNLDSVDSLVSQEPMGKRKANNSSDQQTNKPTKFQNTTVASDLKSLPSQ